MYKSCANCQSELPEHAKYCVNCGQSTKSHRRPFLPFIREALHELLDIDGRLSLTIKTLLFKPGLASLEYDQGKRTKYTPPLRLYLVTSVVFFLIFSSFQHIYTQHSGSAESLTDLYSKAMFLLFPMFALFIKGFFQQSYYLSNLVFSLHVHSVGYLVLMVVGPMEAMEQNNGMLMVLQVPPVIYLTWYSLFAFKTMYQETWPKTIIKASGVFFMYMAALGVMFDVVLGQISPL